MNTIGRKDSLLKSDLIVSSRVSPDPLFLSDNPELYSIPLVSPNAIPQSHDFNYSSFVLNFSKKSYAPNSDSCKKDIGVLVSPFDEVLKKHIIERSDSPYTITKKIDTKETNKFPDHLITRPIDGSDIGYLRSLLDSKQEIPANQPKVKRGEDNTESSSLNFICKHCKKKFGKSQALGGHMSRAHPGKSYEYRQKKAKRKSREVERLKLFLAKRKYFNTLDYNYDTLLKTQEGKTLAQKLINRAQIKKIKKGLTKKEIDNFFESKVLKEINEDLQEDL